MADDMMMVDSKALLGAAQLLRGGGNETRPLSGIGVEVNAEQLEEAARLLIEGPKTSLTSYSGPTPKTPITLGKEEEVGGFIHKGDQVGDGKLVFHVGILAGGTWHIDREGKSTRVYPSAD